LWQSEQDSHFHFGPAFSANITDVRVAVTYDIGVYMLGGTEILNVLFKVNIDQHGGTWNEVCFSLVGVRKNRRVVHRMA
jgi:hypothetical protein